MQKVIISVLGKDRPGIIAAVSRLLFEQNSNIENVSQTSLQSEFAGIFIAAIPRALAFEKLKAKLAEVLDPMGLQAVVKPMEPSSEAAPPPHEAFVITTRGPDRQGLVASVTAVIAAHQGNITNCQAVFKGGSDPNANTMIYEVDIPAATDQQRFFADLKARGAELELQVSIQHRDIFEALSRI
jgi:glycine cleavage system transcriptional repressor